MTAAPPATTSYLIAGQTVDDVTAQAAQPDVGRDRGRRDDLDRGDAQAEQDQRDRDRHLDLEQDLPPGHAHPPGGVGQLRVHPEHPFVGVDQDGRDGQERQRYEPGGRRSGGQHKDQHQQAEGGQRAAEVGQRDHGEAAAPQVAHGQPGGQRDDDGEAQRDAGVHQVLPEPHGDTVGAVPLVGRDQPLPGNAEVTHGTPPARLFMARLWVPRRGSRGRRRKKRAAGRVRCGLSPRGSATSGPAPAARRR